MSDFNPYYEWLGIPPHEQPADHYRLLGLARFESNTTVITNAANRQISHLRMFQAGPRGKIAMTLINEVSKAAACLTSPDKRDEYDRLLRQTVQADIPPQPAPTVPSSDSTPIIKPVAVFNRKPRSKWMQPGLLAAQILVGGIVGVVFALLILQYGFHMDPLRVFHPREIAENTGSSPKPIATPSPNRSTTNSLRPSVPQNEHQGASQLPHREKIEQLQQQAVANAIAAARNMERAANPQTQPRRNGPRRQTSSAQPSNASNVPPTSRPPTNQEAPPTASITSNEQLQLDPRAPVPDDVAQQQARVAVYAVYQEQYDDSVAQPLMQQLVSKAGLARRMLNERHGERDLVKRFVLLDRAREVAVESGDAELTMQIIDELAAGYQVEEFALRQKAFQLWQVAIPRFFTEPTQRKA